MSIRLSIERLRKAGVLQPRIAALRTGLTSFHEPRSARFMPVNDEKIFSLFEKGRNEMVLNNFPFKAQVSFN